MIKLFSLKQQAKEGGAPQSSKKSTAAYLRVQKGTVDCLPPIGDVAGASAVVGHNCNGTFISDIAELNLPKTCQIEFPDPDDLLNFKIVISPDEVNQI